MANLFPQHRFPFFKHNERRFSSRFSAPFRNITKALSEYSDDENYLPKSRLKEGVFI